MDWKITLLILLAVPIAILVVAPLATKMIGISRQLQEETANLQGDFGRVLTDIRLVKAHVAEDIEVRQTERRIKKLFQLGMKETFVMSIVSPVMLSVVLLVVVLIIGYGGIRAAQGLLTTGELIAIILYLFQIVTPFTQLATFFTQYQKANGASARIQDLLNEGVEASSQEDEWSIQRQQFGQVQIDEYEQERTKEQGKWQKQLQEQVGLQFDKVSLSYSEERPILRSISFAIQPNTITAIVGPNGSGKTTLFSLLERFYIPSQGEIKYGEQDIQGYSLKEWRSNIAYVSQESPVMAGTIREQISYGLKAVTEQVIGDALKHAQLEASIRSLPLGLDTAVGERGVLLSGGQHQRLAIARAFLSNSKILLLDEATAHLDSQSEHEVKQALQQVMQNRITLAAAHRMATIVDADQIIVIEQGVITGMGQHEELLLNNECYRNMVEQQQLQQ